ncbi:Phophatidylserine decarboxylase-domain-containing protein [Trametes elegans]|nr:Phophatidylserine decarboxylase-domain-containing protein [Trametes elegans]
MNISVCPGFSLPGQSLGDEQLHDGKVAVDQGVVGSWSCKPNALNERLAEAIAIVEQSSQSRPGTLLHPVIENFRLFIESDPTVYVGFHQMFEQVPTKPPYDNDPSGNPQVRDYNLMLRLFDHIIHAAPKYEDNVFVGFPINAILEWPMGTAAGFAMFCRPDVNAHFKNIFDVWARYLSSPESRYVLNDGPTGWFGEPASKALPDFARTYVCDPSAPHYGFRSWDDFFTRRFRPGVRPVGDPHDHHVITNACESTVYRIAHGVVLTDRFWLKGQPYSLLNMLDHDDLAPRFAGGTVYQAFLSAISYHRWHAPVDGTIVRVVHVPGTYYAEAPCEGFPNPDPAGATLSQSFITSVATRAIIYIEADNPAIGLMVFMAVGMAEVSTCAVGVQEGQRVTKGDELGMFHFGGSTHCLVFREETKVAFNFGIAEGADVKLNEPIARVLL